MDLWTLTGAEWPLSRKFLVVDIGPDALTLPSHELVENLKKKGGVGLVAATQPRGVQAVVLEGGQGLFAKKSARPKSYWIYYECAEGWCRTRTREWHSDIPLHQIRVPAIAKPREPLYIGPMGPAAESVHRIGKPSLRTMTMLYLTEIYMQGRVFYWKDLRLPKFEEVDWSCVENYFGDAPKRRPALMTVNFGVARINANDTVEFFDPIADVEAMRVLAWHANRCGLAFKPVNFEPKPLEDTYWFVAGEKIDRLLDIGRFCLADFADKAKSIK
jgi:hypothetical protein